MSRILRNVGFKKTRWQWQVNKNTKSTEEFDSNTLKITCHWQWVMFIELTRINTNEKHNSYIVNPKQRL